MQRYLPNPTQTGFLPYGRVVRRLLDEGRTCRLTMRGVSMSPVIEDGDALLVEACEAKSLIPGEIALYQSGERLITHVYLGAIGFGAFRRYFFKGLNNDYADIPTHSSDVIGRVRFVEKNERKEALSLAEIRPSDLGFMTISFLRALWRKLA